MQIYKYCRAEHLISAQALGTVRVGTLSDYRHTERYGELTSDSLEGTKLLEATSIANAAGEDMTRDYPGFRGLINFGCETKYTNIRIGQIEVSTPDVLLFSAASSYRREDHVKWMESEGYDACYRINSARLFIRALSDALGTDYQLLGFRQIMYAETLNPESSKSTIHPGFVKRQALHFGQSEMRAIWVARPGIPVQPQILNRTRAHLYVSRQATL